MKKFLMSFLFFSTSMNTLGGEVINYEGKKLNISKKVLLLEDGTKNVKEEDVAKGLYDDKFKPYDRSVLYLSNNNATYYLKLNIQNLSSKSYLSLYGWFGPMAMNITQTSYMHIDKGNFIKEKFISKINKEDKSNLLNYAHGTFNILPNQIKIIYIKINGYLNTPIILTEIENIIKEERVHLAITHLFNGLSLIILLIIVGFYFKLRKKYLLYYILVFTFTYLKSNLFLKFLRNHVRFDVYIIYSFSVIFYIFFLVNFVIDILKLNKRYIEIKNYLNFIKYITIILGSLYLLNIFNLSDFIKLRGYIYSMVFTLILYAAIKRYKDGWLYKAFFFSWLPQSLLYVYISLTVPLKLYMSFFDIRVIEYLEIFVNLFSIAAILLYDAKDLWKDKNTVEDQEKFITILRYADNLMHGMLTLVHSYKKYIKFNRVMFFKRKLDKEHNDVLYYDFSVPIMPNERDEEKKYFDLAKHLHKDTFDVYHICEDIESNELYKTLIEGYKSFIVIRLSTLGEELGYIVILNKDKIEYEFNEITKDFRHKISLLVQYFNNIQQLRESYETRVVDETLRRVHIETLNDAGKDTKKLLSALSETSRIVNHLVGKQDTRIAALINQVFGDVENKLTNVIKDLDFDGFAKKTHNKMVFEYKLIEEMIELIKDALKRETNKVNMYVEAEIESEYELYGHPHVLKIVIEYFLNYLYNKSIQTDKECNIKIKVTKEEGKLRIIGIIEGITMNINDLRNEYDNKDHKKLVNSLKGNLELKSYENKIEIFYLLDLLTKEEKKKFNIKHLDYEDYDDIIH